MMFYHRADSSAMKLGHTNIVQSVLQSGPKTNSSDSAEHTSARFCTVNYTATPHLERGNSETLERVCIYLYIFE